MIQKQFMQEAIHLARQGMQSNEGGPFGAVIVKNGKMIACGSNQVTSKNDCTAHAEIVAIRRACQLLQTFSLQGCDLYTSCEPCPMCLAAALWARVDAIYYAAIRDDAAKIGFDDSYFYKQINLPIAERDIVMQQWCRDDALAVFDAWDKKLDKVCY